MCGPLKKSGIELHIAKLVNDYSGQFRKHYMENLRCCINHKNLKNLQSLSKHFYEHFIKRRPVLAPTWDIIRP